MGINCTQTTLVPSKTTMQKPIYQRYTKVPIFSYVLWMKAIQLQVDLSPGTSTGFSSTITLAHLAWRCIFNYCYLRPLPMFNDTQPLIFIVSQKECLMFSSTKNSHTCLENQQSCTACIVDSYPSLHSLYLISSRIGLSHRK